MAVNYETIDFFGGHWGGFSPFLTSESELVMVNLC